jgi:hypothetical protein
MARRGLLCLLLETILQTFPALIDGMPAAKPTTNGRFAAAISGPLVPAIGRYGELTITANVLNRFAVVGTSDPPNS